jgi:hypothetical protein
MTKPTKDEVDLNTLFHEYVAELSKELGVPENGELPTITFQVDARTRRRAHQAFERWGARQRDGIRMHP